MAIAHFCLGINGRLLNGEGSSSSKLRYAIHANEMTNVDDTGNLALLSLGAIFN